MKNILILILIAAGITSVNAQDNTLYYNTWKVDSYLSVFQDDTTLFYDKALSSNMIDYSKVEFSFSSDGTYTGKNNDGDESTGTCVFDLEKDSIIIDDNGFKLFIKDADHFVSRGYSMDIADAQGTLDTSYNYLTLYRVATVTATTNASGNMDYINVFPNPANQQLNVEVGSNHVALQEIRIINMYGKEVLQLNKINQSNVVINTSDFPVGLYVLEIKDQSGNTTTRKVAKQ